MKKFLQRSFSLLSLISFFCFSFSISGYSQENCKNGIDDDGDGLIDLNDATDCTCPGGVTIPSLIPNASFEQMNCCPSSYSQVNCASGWIQASSATSDYLNTCGFVFGAATAAGLVPFPEGNGILGTIFSPGWQEYVGSCLLQPLNAGTSYTLNMNIASTPIDGYGDVCNGGVINFGPINITLYGSANCSALPFSGSDCPPAAWQVIGSATYNPVSSWGTLAITFTPSTTINAVIFGSPCPLPADYNNPGGCYPYFYYDNLILNSTNLVSSITETGTWCANNIQLTGTSTPSATYQWYLNGVALVGQTNLTLNISSAGLSAGNYSLMTDSAGYCTVASDSVSLGNNPAANFTATGVCVGAASAFTDNSTAQSSTINGWQWNFGDPGSGANNTSTVQNPSHTYATAGTYNVTLVSSGSNGCTDTIVKPVLVNPLPVAGFSVTNVCQSNVSSFTNTSTGTIASATWNFGDGTGTSSSLNTTYTYPSAGTYNVTMTVTTDNGCTSSSTMPAVVNPLPIANFTANNVCLDQTTVFSNSSTVSGGTLASYSWDFGDGTTSSLQTPSHLFQNEGTFPVILTAVSDNGCTGTTTINVSVYPLPLAAFNYTGACPFDTVFFTDGSTTSSGSVAAWNWDFNNGTATSGLQNPAFIYPSAGTFNTSLVVTTNNGCMDTLTLPVQMYDKPIADFSVPNKCLNFSSPFTNQSSPGGIITNVSWNFGDNIGTSGLVSPSYTYTTAGTYNVSLVVLSDSGCSDTINKNTIIHPLPVAGFTANNSCDKDSVNFVNTSTSSSGGIAAFNWNFGDFSTSTLQNPSHLYSGPGTYSVFFTVTSDSGCFGSITNNVIVNPLPLANFSANNVCLDDIALFANTSSLSTGNIVYYSWNFGDNNNSINPDPTHQYNAAGTFNVSLVAISDSGCIDTVVKQIQIYPEPVSAFTTSDVCQYDSAKFTDVSSISSGNLSSFIWNFGDGFNSSVQNPSHLFSSPGTFTVIFTVSSDNGCVDSSSQSLIIFPVPQPAFSSVDVCQYSAAQFTDASSISSGTIPSYQWDFGDGSGSAIANPSHNFSSEGTFTVELVVISDNGCRDSVSQPINIFPVPQADFSFPNVCLYDWIQFTNNTSLNGSFTSSWDFGDQNTSSLQSPSHQYNSDGIYNVVLIVNSVNNCSDTIMKQDTIYPVPVSIFNFNNNCLSDTADFFDGSTISSGIITEWNWNFGDATSSVSQNPAHLYPAAGNYDVTLIVTSANNCSDTLTKTIVQFPIPTANFEADSVCLNNITSFSDLSSGNGDTINSWTWIFGDGSPLLLSTQNPSHLFSAAGYYFVTQIVETSNFCEGYITDTIVVFPLPLADFVSDTVCLNASPTTFNSITSPTGFVTTWSWNFGDNTSGTGQTTSHSYSSSGIFNVQLSVKTDKNCTDDIIKQIKVNAPPEIAFVVNKSAGCDPLCIQFTGIPFPGTSISKWLWEFGDGEIESVSSPGHCFSPAGQYDVKLTVTNSEGCIKDSLTPKYIYVYPNPVAGFVLSPETTSIMYPVIDFTDMSAGANNWYWNFGDSAVVSFQNPVHEYTDTGTYTVMQIVKNQFNCQDTIYKTVIITAEFRIYIPNAFTPDGDEINDIFLPEGIGFSNENYGLYIFDRWGDIIYETHNAKGFWDGNLRGQPAKQDVYVYLIEVMDFEGNPYKFNGRVTLLRR